VNFCEIEQDATLQRAIDYVKPALPLEQGADGLPNRDGGRVIFFKESINLTKLAKAFPGKAKRLPLPADATLHERSRSRWV